MPILPARAARLRKFAFRWAATFREFVGLVRLALAVCPLACVRPDAAFCIVFALTALDPRKPLAIAAIVFWNPDGRLLRRFATREARCPLVILAELVRAAEPVARETEFVANDLAVWVALAVGVWVAEDAPLTGLLTAEVCGERPVTLFTRLEDKVSLPGTEVFNVLNEVVAGTTGVDILPLGWIDEASESRPNNLRLEENGSPELAIVTDDGSGTALGEGFSSEFSVTLCRITAGRPPNNSRGHSATSCNSSSPLNR